MKKSVQYALNNKALAIWENAISEYNEGKGVKKEIRLFTCKAQILETENFYILRSYNTLVAAYDIRHIELTDVLRYVYGYTATSAQHIAKFRNYVYHKEHLGWGSIDEYRYNAG